MDWRREKHSEVTESLWNGKGLVGRSLRGRILDDRRVASLKGKVDMTRTAVNLMETTTGEINEIIRVVTLVM